MAKAAAGLINAILDPVLAKRAGVSLALISSWEEIAGSKIAAQSMPLRIKWPRRISEDDAFHPGALVIAAEGAAALHIQHQTGEIIARVNGFLGYPAIDKVRIEQKPVARKAEKRPSPKPVSQSRLKRVSAMADTVEDDALRDALKRLGENVARKGG